LGAKAYFLALLTPVSTLIYCQFSFFAEKGFVLLSELFSANLSILGH